VIVPAVGCTGKQRGATTAGSWATPRAAAWELMGDGVLGVVARYVEMLARVESPAVAAEVRLIEDRLGLSPQALLRLRWVIAPDDSEPPEPPRRLRVVDDLNEEGDLT
jgi:hypothetical protein